MGGTNIGSANRGIEAEFAADVVSLTESPYVHMHETL